jgi:D-sedoheptulose 7-phosphate isomerase
MRIETQVNEQIQRLIVKYPDLASCAGDIGCTFRLMRDSFRQGRKLLVCGNGGSASDSEHIVAELMKGFRSKRPLPAGLQRRLLDELGPDGAYLASHLQGALPAISLVSHTSLLTSFANDVAADLVFAQQVYGYGKAGDVLLGISTSGNSKNVRYALQAAKVLGLRTAGLVGGSTLHLARYCDALISAPVGETSDVQERHIAIYHALAGMLEDEFFGGRDLE